MRKWLKFLARWFLRGLMSVLNYTIDEWQAHLRSEISNVSPKKLGALLDHEIDKLQVKLNMVITDWLD